MYSLKINNKINVKMGDGLNDFLEKKLVDTYLSKAEIVRYCVDYYSNEKPLKDNPELFMEAFKLYHHDLNESDNNTIVQITMNTQEFIDQLKDSIECFGCSPKMTIAFAICAYIIEIGKQY